ncbi:nucleoside hydrolase 3-like isoform X2 [Quercus robur]|nr:nucleoside hydrolase 3-like isoform X2 [Quercus robur]XP_050240249.1 nucleoside hydrolase 3-like isoform X2 [Quercus robur]XP_050240250.1 nucleoside hydrolase 3-like isoform X2 [Quercus robur]XP_050240251.1 nucleoside hydrolase 3-like isoform X2 [Quercus robur]XP_050240252.1 nucleoside hydrolase 3-like isoform X2 [Quercus robur]
MRLMVVHGNFWVVVLLIIGVVGAYNLYNVECLPLPHRILLDADVDTDDFLALLYLLKQNRSEFKVEAVTISANSWSDAGHAVNHIYDILYMMDRDDVAVGVGGDGGILEDGTILPNVGGYLPIIEQGNTTAGYCRYRQAIPPGQGGGRLDIDANFGIRRAFLPQGIRKYTPLQQSTSQQVMIDKISWGPITVIITGSHTNLAIFLMKNPHLKRNIEHIYIMGGSVRSKNGDPGNLFSDSTSNPYAEFNIFADPFASYQVFHSGIPITLIPLDATNTIPVSKNFFDTFEKSQNTYEAQYCFQSLKTDRDTTLGDLFYTNFYMWDAFAAGVAISIMHKSNNTNGENEFAEMEYMNITVVTSNKPYGVHDGSNPFFDGRDVPRFNLTMGGVHSGHVQTGLRDPFCIVKNGTGKCQDGYTAEVTGPEAVRVLVATEAKPNQNNDSTLDKQFYISFLDALNRPQDTGRFNFTTQFPYYYKEVLYKPDFGSKKLGKTVVFDMDMSAGDFLALFYLLKAPVEVINLKAIIVSPTGWANAATIDIIYDLLHMMGRDDIPVGLGDIFAMNQSDSILSSVGDCKYIKAIPHGSGGLIDSDTLYSLARDLPRSPRRYTQDDSPNDGATQKQPLAFEVWKSVVKTLDPGSKITILTNGPLTNLAKIIQSEENTTSFIQDVYIVGGHISRGDWDKGNVFTIHSNEFAEFNMFLDPLAAKTVFDSNLNITLIPLGIQRRVGSLPRIIQRLQETKRTPEAKFASRLLSMLYGLQQSHFLYHHVDIFSGEILGAVALADDLKPNVQVKPVKILAEGVESTDGQTVIDEKEGKFVKILENVNSTVFYDLFADRLNDTKQSAVIGSFDGQRRQWSRPPI